MSDKFIDVKGELGEINLQKENFTKVYYSLRIFTRKIN